MAGIYILEKSGFCLISVLAVAIILSLVVFSAVQAEDISASCHEYCQDRDHDHYDGYDQIHCPLGTDLNDTNPAIHPNANENCNNKVDDDCDGKIDCLDSDCMNGTICRAMCSNYITSQICSSYGCSWLPACSGPKINPYGSNVCLGEKFNGNYSKCSKQSCGASCENNSDCGYKLVNSTCFFAGACNDSCSCEYFSQVCPAAGTIINGTCYYGDSLINNSCTPNGCALNSANMSGNDFCNNTEGPQDKIGPIILNAAVMPAINNGTFNITASVNDAKSPINSAEYFLKQGNDSLTCGAHGSGTEINPADDGVFNQDRLAENISAVSVKFEPQGFNKVCLQAQDASGNFGNCTCIDFEVDSTPPSEEGNISFNSISGQFGGLVCNTSPIMNVTFCDSRSEVLSAEYFLDMSPVGYGLNVLNNHSKSDGSRCSNFSGKIDISNLSEGLHNISGLAAKDTLLNQRNYYFGEDYSFVKDSIPPETEVVFSSENHWNCTVNESNGANLSRCFFVLNGTQALLNASDIGLQDSGKFAANLTTYYRLWTRLNETDAWPNVKEEIYLKNQTFGIILENSTEYLFEVWSEDICGFSEAHKFNLIIAVVPICGDGQCNYGETSAICPSDCQTKTKASSSGTGTSHNYGVGQWVPVNKTNTTIETINLCESNWACGEWSECLDGIKTRECIDLNNCSANETALPETIAFCAAELKPLSYCGDGVCDPGEDCPMDCPSQVVNTAPSSLPTGNFMEIPSGLLSALIFILIIAISAHIMYKNQRLKKAGGAVSKKA